MHPQQAIRKKEEDSLEEGECEAYERNVRPAQHSLKVMKDSLGLDRHLGKLKEDKLQPSNKRASVARRISAINAARDKGFLRGR